MNKKPSQITGLVILHTDLRTHDNATLLKASVTCDYLLIVYPKQPFSKFKQTRGQAFHAIEHEKIGESRQHFIQQSLVELNDSLKSLGNQLIYLDADKTGISPYHHIVQLIGDYSVSHVFVSRTADYDQNQNYDLLKKDCPNLQWHESVTSTLFENLPTDPNAQKNDSENLPNIFTQFRKRIEKSYDLLTAEKDCLISPTPSKLPSMPECKKLQALYYSQQYSTDNSSLSSPFHGGEKQALIHLEAYFGTTSPQTYKQTRNALFLNDSDGSSWQLTTRFSPWLANGCLSVRVLLNRLRKYEREQVANESTYWIWFELLWREYFYWYANTHGKKLFLMSGITGKKSRKCFYGERYERWKNGTTPYPIVNACMKQLKTTGYLSNRGRQLVASCFIHELGLDWRYGASYFEQQLIDYDVASNWGNWQYLAGVGANPRGSRQFNLEKQTQQYDPNGAFIKKWGGADSVAPLDSVDMVDWYV